MEWRQLVLGRALTSDQWKEGGGGEAREEGDRPEKQAAGVDIKGKKLKHTHMRPL